MQEMGNPFYIQGKVLHQMSVKTISIKKNELHFYSTLWVVVASLQSKKKKSEIAEKILPRTISSGQNSLASLEITGPLKQGQL